MQGFQVRSFIRLLDARQYIRNYNCYGSEDSESDDEHEQTAMRQDNLQPNLASGSATVSVSDTRATNGSAASTAPSAQPLPHTQPGQHVPATANIILSDEQKAVLAEVQKGKSIFFTGPAGMCRSLIAATQVNS